MVIASRLTIEKSQRKLIQQHFSKESDCGSIFYWDMKKAWVVLGVDLCREETTRVGRKVEQWPDTQSITGTGRFLTRSTLFLGASLQALVDAELVGALLDGKDGGA